MKKEKIIVWVMLVFLTLGTIFLFLFGGKYEEPKTIDDQLTDIRKTLRSITHKEDFYNHDEEIINILNNNSNKFLKTDLDLFFSDYNNFDGIILPNENIYCIDAWWSEQTGKNFQSYRVYMEWNLTKEIMNMYGRHSEVAYNYLHNKEIDETTVLWKMVVWLQNNTDELLSYYKNEDYINFRKKIYDINWGVNNIDILTIVFFEKNNLDKNKLIDFLNRCFDYNNNWFVNTEYVKETIYKYLVK